MILIVCWIGIPANKDVLAITPRDALPEALPLSDIDEVNLEDRSLLPIAKDWAKAARDEAFRRYQKAVLDLLNQWMIPVTSLSLPKIKSDCSSVQRGIVDGCKKGVRGQVAYCKQALRDAIAKCKNDVKSEIDRCKKSTINPLKKIECESRRYKIPECETKRIDVPLCEFDRLTAACCETMRPQAAAMCAAGVSVSEITKQVQALQTYCSIGTGFAKSAVKSYLTGQAIGFIADAQELQTIGKTIKVAQKISDSKKKFDQWTEGMTQAAEGKYADAQKALVAISSQINPNLKDAAAWMEAAKAVAAKDMDGLVDKLTSTVNDMKYVQQASKIVMNVQTVSNDIKAISEAAKKCSQLPTELQPENFAAFKKVKSEKDVAVALAAYEKAVQGAQSKVAFCLTVFSKAARTLSFS